MVLLSSLFIFIEEVGGLSPCLKGIVEGLTQNGED